MHLGPRSVAISWSRSATPERYLLCVASSDHKLRMIDHLCDDAWKPPQLFEGHTAAVNSLQMDPRHESGSECRFIVSGGDDHTVRRPSFRRRGGVGQGGAGGQQQQVIIA